MTENISNTLLKLMGNLLRLVGEGCMCSEHAIMLIQDYMVDHDYPAETVLDVLTSFSFLASLDMPPDSP